jgi:molybdate transport system regulatory protein
VTPRLRFRVDFAGRCSVGIGKIELLEAIAASGSLVRAARSMHMSYRRAGLLLHDLNTSFDQPVADASVGGRGGGGVTLTAFGSSLVSGYRALEVGVHSAAQDYLKKFVPHSKTSTAAPTPKPAALKHPVLKHAAAAKKK